MTDRPPPDARVPLRLAVIHETLYRYAAPVLQSRQLLHLTPRALPHQRVVTHRIRIEPAPAEQGEGDDFFGNRIVRALIGAPHRALEIHAASVVDVGPRGDPQDLRTPPDLARLRAALAAPADAATLEAARFAFESPHVPFDPAVRTYAAPSFAGRAPLPEALADLSRRIHRDFEFDPAATTVATPLAEVIALRRGVCQDFAHLMIGCVRAQGLAARYVSGYLLTAPPPGQARLIGSDASHAWVAVYCPGADGQGAHWLEFDPTNDCRAGTGHVTLGWGRDFSDVTPTRGVLLGGGTQTLEVRVTVTPAPDQATAGYAAGT
ncbi:MAG: transglutaminase family protein [Burkholderiales bacterium]|nr:transglutaminase family protein [Burkholderiales bacterium]